MGCRWHAPWRFRFPARKYRLTRVIIASPVCSHQQAALRTGRFGKVLIASWGRAAEADRRHANWGPPRPTPAIADKEWIRKAPSDRQSARPRRMGRLDSRAMLRRHASIGAALAYGKPSCASATTRGIDVPFGTRAVHARYPSAIRPSGTHRTTMLTESRPINPPFSRTVTATSVQHLVRPPHTRYRNTA